MPFGRSFIVMVLIHLLSMLHLSTSGLAQEPAKPPGEPLVFVTVADLHVTDDASMAGFRQAIELINNAIKPAFVYVAGDTPDGGTLGQYQAYKAVRDTINFPVYDVLGDHEARGGGTEHYRKVLGEPTYSFAVGPYHFVGLNSMQVDGAQIEWVGKELAAARDMRRIPIVFIHHNLAGLKDKAAVGALDKMLQGKGVKLVLAGHTHNNVVINNGARLDITTTSIKAPRGKDPKGFAIVTLDQGRIAWHFVPLGQETLVATCSPISRLMATGPEGIVSGKLALRVKAWDAKGIKTVTASVDGASPVELKLDADLWTAQQDAAALKDGEHTLKVVATNTAGQSAAEEIAFLVNQAGTYTAAPMTVSDAGPGGKDGGKGGEKKPKDDKGDKGGKGKKEAVTLEQVPEPVRAVIKQKAGDAPLGKLEKENKDGQATFKADWTIKEMKQEIRLSETGAVLESKQQITPADLPEPVASAAKKAIGDLKEAECKKIVQSAEGKAFEIYEVKADTAEGKKHIAIAPDGAVEVRGGGKGPKK